MVAFLTLKLRGRSVKPCFSLTVGGRLIEHFIGFWLCVRRVRHGLFDADDLTALRALAEYMTGAIHFAFGPS
jgi:hypothetical protein